MQGRNHVAWRSRSSRSVGVPLFVYLIWTVVSVNAADDAAALMARVLATNAPWLNPAPAKGTYNLHFTEDGKADYTTGPFDLAGFDNQVTHPDRVGSLVWTPLHEMAAQSTPYTVSAAGTTNWNGTNLTMVDVTFDTSAGLEIGFGGQVISSGRYVYCHATFDAQTARLIIETNNAVPIVMLTYSQYGDSTWEFDPFFLPLGKGLVPRAFDQVLTSWLHERQEFQVVGDIWLFKRGDAWWEGTNVFKATGHVLTCELVNLTLELRMSVVKTTDGLDIILPAPQAAGFSVLAADEVTGPWSPVQSQMSADALTISVSRAPNTLAQFYRLTK